MSGLQSSNRRSYRELSFVQRRPVEGTSTSGVNIMTVLRKQRLIYSQHNNNGIENNKSADFVYYDEEDETSDTDEGFIPFGGESVSCNVADCLLNREMGLDRTGFQRMRLTSEYGTRHILSNAMLREYTLNVPDMNKVFSSQWLSYRQVVFGTKCNKLMVYDVNTRHLDQIPSLHSSQHNNSNQSHCGIHSIQINPSRTLLATGAKNTHNIAVYRLPTLDPVCVGENAHDDWIFDIAWLDDQFLVSGSRDGSLALWRITDDMINEVASSDIPCHISIQPLSKKHCKSAQRVRSLCYNERSQEVVAISGNGFIHCWNALKFRQLMSKKLPHSVENVCLSADEDSTMYAVGSKANTDLIDARTLQAIRKISSRHNGYGIRSVSFKGNILTIGTGLGMILFWDLRAGKFLESTMNSNRSVSLKTSKGCIRRDEHYLHNEPFNAAFRYSPAVYTHCYDISGTRLFAAGGPLESDAMGNYVGLFQ
eukprot:TRINITY_DN2484_c0_g1_i2.p1 TRINITY_DN2484_c0_g1~~TRINITY_DN2484_c0_g1_i2.p1  ORF type:complete len:480 (-),score=93.05 TRINITY_DN2484_c0_g1_i2:479-1918(-)